MDIDPSIRHASRKTIVALMLALASIAALGLFGPSDPAWDLDRQSTSTTHRDHA